MPHTPHPHGYTAPYRPALVHALCTPAPAGPTPVPCPGCRNDATPATTTHHCATCAVGYTAHGQGDRAGLPVPATTADLDRAVAALGQYVATHSNRPSRVLVDALLLASNADRCPECDRWVDHMSDLEQADHVLVGGSPYGRRADWVAVGCEGYVLPATRAAALALATVE